MIQINRNVISYITLRLHFIKKTEELYNLSMEYIITKNENILYQIKRTEGIKKFGYPDFIGNIIITKNNYGNVYKSHKLRYVIKNKYYIYEE